MASTFDQAMQNHGAVQRGDHVDGSQENGMECDHTRAFDFT
jgi:hypothetical protein